MKLCFAFLALLLLATCSGNKSAGGLSPEDGLRSIKLSEDFKAELFAHEPDVMDPVEVAFDEHGRAYAVEMPDLHDDPIKDNPKRSRVRLLEDTNGDGVADKSTLFAANLSQSSGLMPWNGGLIVCAAPEVLFLKDTDGDGKADVREVWLTGFFHGNPEAHISNPRLGPDNWIYFANMGNEGKVTSPKNPKHEPVQLRGNDFRFNPVTFDFEPASGATQYGLAMDDWGNRFSSQNTTHLRHTVLPRHYLARAPLLDAGSVMHDPYEGYERKMWPVTQPQEWRVIRTKLRQERYNELKNGRVEHLAGYFTGATGGTMYLGDAWPAEYQGNIFTGDVSANLVRRDVLTPDGVTFKARPVKEGVEFLASTDQWFRPTNFANAPDGNLYLTDMQREFIETPLSIPEQLKKSINFSSGDTLGRIYRIVPNNPRMKRGLKTDIAGKQGADLAKFLEHANGWHRVTAQRMILEKQDRGAIPALKELAANSPSAPARLRSLYLLRTFGVLDPAMVEAALKDPRAEVREHAIAMAEAFPALEPKVRALAADKAPRIQLQLALSLGNFRTPAARAAVVDLAAANIKDRWIRMAALSSAADAPVAFQQALLAKGQTDIPRDLLTAIGGLVGSRKDPAEIQTFLIALGRGKSPDAGLRGLANGLRLVGAKQVRAPGVEAALTGYLNSGVEAAWDVARYFELKALVDRASKDVLNAGLPVKQRVLALTALRGAAPAAAVPLIGKVLGSNPGPEVQVAAVLSLSTFDDAKVGPELLTHWKSYSPEARTKAIGALLAQKDRTPLLLEALEKQQVEVSMLEVAARNRLLESSDPKVVERARAIFRDAGGDRAKVAASFRDVASMKGDVTHGKQVFEDACARCHLPRRQGGRVGPDLSGINMKSKDELIEAILNPSGAIDPRYVNYMITDKAGRMYDGVLASETAGAVTLRGGSEEDVTILRSSIAEIRSSAISLMPEDLEKSMSKQDLADVIAYLRGGL
ncbi:MAG: c-type cytochrome [Acidobacteria bacterium]|nr:c-type cytochrome [Acidobacteriota bacterium]